MRFSILLTILFALALVSTTTACKCRARDGSDIPDAFKHCCPWNKGFWIKHDCRLPEHKWFRRAMSTMEERVTARFGVVLLVSLERHKGVDIDISHGLRMSGDDLAALMASGRC
jgi:hypothetical protein